MQPAIQLTQHNTPMTKKHQHKFVCQEGKVFCQKCGSIKLEKVPIPKVESPKPNTSAAHGWDKKTWLIAFDKRLQYYASMGLPSHIAKDIWTDWERSRKMGVRSFW